MPGARLSSRFRPASSGSTLAWTVSLGLHAAAFAAMSVIAAKPHRGAAEHAGSGGGIVLDSQFMSAEAISERASSYVIQTSFTLDATPIRPLAELVNAPALFVPT